MDDFKEVLKPENVKRIIRNPVTALEYSITRYLVIGFSTFFLDYGILKSLVVFFDIDPVLANIISTLVALLYNFTLSNFWTFKAGASQKAQKLGKYAVLATINYFITVAVFSFLVRHFELTEDWAKVLVTGMVTTWNFLLYKYWVFQKD